jgi:hypothetical protein
MARARRNNSRLNHHAPANKQNGCGVEAGVVRLDLPRAPTPSSSLSLSVESVSGSERERERSAEFSHMGFLHECRFYASITLITERERPVASARSLSSECMHMCWMGIILVSLGLGAFTVHLRRTDECTCCKSWLNYTGGGADEQPLLFSALLQITREGWGLLCACDLCLTHWERVAFWQVVHNGLVDIIISVMWFSWYFLCIFRYFW